MLLLHPQGKLGFHSSMTESRQDKTPDIWAKDFEARIERAAPT